MNIFHSEMILDEAQREENFPMQEQAQGPQRGGTEKTAAVILAECLTEAGSGIAAPSFVP